MQGAIDYAAVLVELRCEIAAKPSHGRQDLLVRLAELEGEHRVPEDELDRALRLVMPQLLDLLFNRAPQLADEVQRVLSQGSPASHGGVRAGRDAQGATRSMVPA